MVTKKVHAGTAAFLLFKHDHPSTLLTCKLLILTRNLIYVTILGVVHHLTHRSRKVTRIELLAPVVLAVAPRALIIAHASGLLDCSKFIQNTRQWEGLLSSDNVIQVIFWTMT